MKGLNLFLDLFNFYPNMQILEIGNIENKISQTIREKLSECEGELKSFDFNSREFSIREIKIEPRSYEHIVLYEIISEELLELTYHALENSGDLVFLFKKGILDIAEVKELISSRGFVAVNDIDIFDEFDLISAKKMHMWTRGY